MENDGNTATNLSPVTESEMRGWFERLATTFVGLAKQATELDEMKLVVAALTSRLDNQVGETEKARKDISELYGMINNLEHERDELKSQVAWRDETIATLNNTLNTRDDTIASQKSDVTRLNNELWSKGQELAEHQKVIDKQVSDIGYWKRRAESFESSYLSVCDDLTSMTRQFQGMEAERNTLRDTVGKMKGLLDSLNLAPNPVLPVPEPTQETKVDGTPKYESQSKGDEIPW